MIALQSARYSLQYRTAPVVAGAVCGCRGAETPGLSQTGANVVAFGTRDSVIQRLAPQDNAKQAPRRPPGSFKAGHTAGFRLTLSGPSCRQGASGEPRGTLWVATISESRQSSVGALLSKSCGLLGKRTASRGIFLDAPWRKPLMSENHESNQSLTLGKAQANYDQPPSQ